LGYRRYRPGSVQRELRRRKRSKGYKLAWAALLLVVAMALFVLYSPYFAVETIEVQGIQMLSQKELLEEAGLFPGMNLLQVRPSLISSRLLSNPWVEEVTVQRGLPGYVLVLVQEREPVVLVPNGSSFLCLDREARVLDTWTVAKVSLPFLTGFRVPARTFPGQVLEDTTLRLVLAALASLSKSTLGMISEVHLDNESSITVYTLNGVPVYLGQAFDSLPEKFQVLDSILKDIRDKDTEVEYVDLHLPHRPVVKERR